MSDLTFYTNPMSRGRIIRWMLEETGATYDTEIIEYGPQMKSEPFISINPMGKVPAIRHRDQIVTECAAICAYLADAFPEAELAPPPSERADYYRWMFFAAGPLEQAIVNKSLGVEVTEEQQAMAGYGNFDTTIATLVSTLENRDYIANNRFTAADVYVGSQVSWGLGFGSLPKLEPLEAYAARVTDRSAYARAQEIDGPLPS